MAARSGGHMVGVDPEELIPLPPGSDLLVMPGRVPVGIPREGGGDGGRHVHQAAHEVALVEGVGTVQAVVAFLAPAYLRYLNPATGQVGVSGGGGGADGCTPVSPPLLPLYAYTAVGWRDGRFWVPAVRIDPDLRQELQNFDLEELPVLVERRLAREPENGLLRHLARCALHNCCPAARNLFYGRWEAPLPTSPGCNASCIGCISEQPDGRVSTFERIGAPPSVGEVEAVAVPHLEEAERAVVSFGQGCEGEPLLQADLLEQSIRRIRQRTSKGIINLNSNASLPRAVEALCGAGLDSIRISLNSANEDVYCAYYNPRHYRFRDVLESLDVARRNGVWVSLNYLIFPGISDTAREVEALLELLRSHDVNLVQWRNLNIDPRLYLDTLAEAGVQVGPPLGIQALLQAVRREFPHLRFGYFNPPREEMGSRWGTSPIRSHS